MTKRVATGWIVVSSTWFFVFAYLFAGIGTAIRGGSFQPLTITVPAPSLGVILGPPLAIVLVVAVHELGHGFLMARFGGRPSYGIRFTHFVIPHAYASTSGVRYARNRMLVILLGPFVFVTLVGIGLLSISTHPLLVGALAINAAGSVGDLWMALRLLRYPSSVRVGALPGSTGFGIYATGEAHAVERTRPERSRIQPSRRRSESTTAVSLASFLAGLAGTVSVLVAALCALVLGSLAFATGDVTIGDPDGPWSLFRHELDAGDRTALLEVGGPLFVGLSVIGALAWTTVSVVRRRLVVRRRAAD